MLPAIVCTVLSLCCLLAGYVDRATGGHRPLFALSIVVVGPMLRGSLDPIILDTFGPIFRTIRSRLPQQTQTGSPVPGKRTALALAISPLSQGMDASTERAHHVTAACLRLVQPTGSRAVLGHLRALARHWPVGRFRTASTSVGCRDPGQWTGPQHRP